MRSILSEPLSNTQLKNRLLGAGILVFVAVIMIPLFLGEPKYAAEQEPVPPKSNKFESKIQPLPENVPAPQNVVESDSNEASESAGLVLKKLDNRQAPASGKSDQVVIQPLRLDKLNTTDPAPKARKQPAPAPKAKPVVEQAPVKSKPDKPKTVPAPTQVAKVKSGWAVQAGIFSKPENAQAIAQILKNNGYMPNISDARASFGKARRVWIGPFAQKSEAQAISKRLEQKTGDGGYVAVYPFKS
jgi:DedD protein